MSSSRPLLVAATGVLAFSLLGCAGAKPSQSPSPAATVAAPSPSAEASTPLATTAASETAAPLPTTAASPATGGNFLAGLRYSCGGASFPIEMFDVPARAEDSTDPPAAVLRGELMLRGPITWWLIERTPTTAQYAGIDQNGAYYDLFAELVDGKWRATGYGDCRMQAVAEGASVVTWWIRDAAWPSAEDRTLELTVRDGCPQTVEDRMLQPIVRSNADSIVIVLPTETVRQDSCGLPTGNDQLTRVTIRLDEPVGDRELFDGASIPLRNAHQRSDPISWCCG